MIAMHQAGLPAEPAVLAEQAGQRVLMALAEPGDRAVIGHLVRGDHAVRDILDAAGVEPLVTFSQSRLPGRTRILPSVAEYATVVDAVLTRYPFVREFRRVPRASRDSDRLTNHTIG